MSLLGIAKAVAEEVGIQGPTSIIGNAGRTEKQLLRLINRAGKLLAKKNWAILQKEYTFSTVIGTESYALPSGYDRLLDQAAWDRTSYWQLRGPLNARQWQVQKSALVASATLRSNYRIKVDTYTSKIYIDPTPTAVVDLVFEYASSKWVKDSGSTTTRSSFQADDDEGMIDEDLIEMEVIWRFLARKGFDYSEEKDQAEREIARAFAEDGGAPVLDFGGAMQPVAQQIPEGNFTL